MYEIISTINMIITKVVESHSTMTSQCLSTHFYDSEHFHGLANLYLPSGVRTELHY